MNKIHNFSLIEQIMFWNLNEICVQIRQLLIKNQLNNLSTVMNTHNECLFISIYIRMVLIFRTPNFSCRTPKNGSIPKELICVKDGLDQKPWLRRYWRSSSKVVQLSCCFLISCIYWCLVYLSRFQLSKNM